MCIRRQRRNTRSPSTEQKLFGPDEFFYLHVAVQFLLTPESRGPWWARTDILHARICGLGEDEKE